MRFFGNMRGMIGDLRSFCLVPLHDPRDNTAGISQYQLLLVFNLLSLCRTVYQRDSDSVVTCDQRVSFSALGGVTIGIKYSYLGARNQLTEALLPPWLPI
jgi:hypothetical protein